MTGTWLCTLMNPAESRHTRLQLFDRLTSGHEPPVSDLLRAELGIRMEPVHLWALRQQSGSRLTRYRRTWIAGRLAASPDAGDKRTGLLVELKSRAWLPDEPTTEHRWQCLAALLVIPWAREAWLSYLVGTRMARFTLTREEAEAERPRVVAELDRFWSEHVEPGVPPAPDLERDGAELILRFPALPIGTVEATGALLHAGDAYAGVRAVSRDAQTAEKPLRAAFAAEVARSGADTVVGPDWVATVKATTDERRTLTFRLDREESAS